MNANVANRQLLVIIVSVLCLNLVKLPHSDQKEMNDASHITSLFFLFDNPFWKIKHCPL